MALVILKVTIIEAHRASLVQTTVYYLRHSLGGFHKQDSTLNIWLCSQVRLVLNPNLFQQKFGIPQAECLVLEHSMQFKQEYDSPHDLLVALTDGAY
jgi:hypothetical protein